MKKYKFIIVYKNGPCDIQYSFGIHNAVILSMASRIGKGMDTEIEYVENEKEELFFVDLNLSFKRVSTKPRKKLKS